MKPGLDYPAIACGAYIMNDKEEFLMLLRSEQARNDKGMWGIPGGLVEFGETVVGAVIRESLEECGLSIKKPELLTYYDHFLPEEQSHFVSIIFQTKIFTGTPVIRETAKFRATGWFNIKNIPSNTSIVVLDSMKYL